MLIDPIEFLNYEKTSDSTLSLVCSEVLVALERFCKAELLEELSREENSMASEIYAMANKRYNWLNNFYDIPSEFVACSGIRVVSDDRQVYLKFRQSLPLPNDFTAIDLGDSVFEEIKHQFDDFYYRHEAVRNSESTSRYRVEQIKRLSKASNSASQFLDSLSKLGSTERIVANRMILTARDIERRISNNEALI